MSKPDGGSAFPRPLAKDAIGPSFSATEGMTLRDYFAAAAMRGFMAGPAMTVLAEAADESKIDAQTFIVRNAYEIADAMLAERNKP